MLDLLRVAQRRHNANVTELIQILSVSLNEQEGPQVSKECVHLSFLRLCVCYVAEFNPFQEKLF